MNKSFIKSRPRLGKSLALPRLETGFSMLEAVVVVGVLLALAVSGFFAYGSITENAKKAKVKSAASEIYTGVVVADSDGDSNTQPQDVIDNWNARTEDIRAEILDPVAGNASANGDFCVSATNVKNPLITARAGSCDNVAAGGGGTGGDPINPPSAGIMRTTWDTSIVSEWDFTCSTITLPLTGTVDATIDWGDGTAPEKVTTTLPSHEYIDTPGVKTVNIDGTFTGWAGADLPPWNEDFTGPSWSNHCITEVTEWGETGTSDAEYGFSSTSALTEVARIPLTVTSFRGLFERSQFNGNINGWDTSRITDMAYMFGDNRAFNKPLNNWNTSSVTDMERMFYNTIFNQPIGGWNTSKVANLSNMFEYAEEFDQPIGGWNTSSVTTLSQMFASASKFNQDLAWDTSKVTEMNDVFSSAYLFNGNVSNWDTSKVTNMNQTFHGSAFNGDVSRWNTSNVTTMLGTFSWSPFNGDVSQWDTSKVTNMMYLFANSDFNGDVSSWNTSSVTDMGGMFQNNKVFDGDISRWNTSHVTDMSLMFLEASAFNGDILRWETSSVTTMSYMFDGALSFNQDLSGWNVDNVVGHDQFANSLQLDKRPTFN